MLMKKGNLNFQKSKYQIYVRTKKGIKAKTMNFVCQLEINLRIFGVGIFPVYFPFLLPEDIKRWKEQGFFHVHFSYVDITVHPHFNYDCRS